MNIKTIYVSLLKEWTAPKPKEKIKDYPRTVKYMCGLLDAPHNDPETHNDTVGNYGTHFDYSEKLLTKMGHTPNTAYDLGKKHSEFVPGHNNGLPPDSHPNEHNLFNKFMYVLPS